VIEHKESLLLAESKYRTIYRTEKWTTSRNDPTSGFYVNTSGRGRMRGDGGRGRGRRQGASGGRGRDANRWSRLNRHNCGRLGRIARNCWAPGHGQEVYDVCSVFPGVNNASILTAALK